MPAGVAIEEQKWAPVGCKKNCELSTHRKTVFVEASEMLEWCFHLVVPITNQNDDSINGTRWKNNTAVVVGLIHYKDTKTVKNLIISTWIIGNCLNRKSFSGYRWKSKSSGMWHFVSWYIFMDSLDPEDKVLISSKIPAFYCIYQSAWCCIPEDLSSHRYCCENFRSLFG